MPTDAVSRRRMYSGSTSIPAKNVSTIDPNDAMKSNQLADSIENRFPATTPSVSSTSATVTPSSTETMLASSTTVANAAASCTGSTMTSYKTSFDDP